MQPRIQMLPEKKFVGKQLSMTMAENKTAALWQSFMPVRNKIENRASSNLYSIQVYNEFNVQHFNSRTPFTKWAAVEVTHVATLPVEMEAFTLASGLYAVFLYKGLPENFYPTWQYIFHTWLPQSDYLIADRPHFELLKETYTPTDPNSEEEIWIPVMAKG
jgi:AraC family transcriptional regulator